MNKELREFLEQGMFLRAATLWAYGGPVEKYIGEDAVTSLYKWKGHYFEVAISISTGALMSIEYLSPRDQRLNKYVERINPFTFFYN